MAIANLNLPYNDFRLNEIIDPEQFDINNAQIVSKMNELVARINQGFDTGDIGIGVITGNNIAADSIGEDKLTSGVRDKLNKIATGVDAEKIRGIPVEALVVDPENDGKVLTYDAVTQSFLLKTKASGGVFYSPSIRGIDKWAYDKYNWNSETVVYSGVILNYPFTYATSNAPK